MLLAVILVLSHVFLLTNIVISLQKNPSVMSNGMSNGPGSMPACSEAGSTPQDAPTSQANSDSGPDQPCQTGPKGNIHSYNPNVIIIEKTFLHLQSIKKFDEKHIKLALSHSY